MKVFEVVYHGYHECSSSDCCFGWGSDDSSLGLYGSMDAAKGSAPDEAWVDGPDGASSGRYSIKVREVVA